MPEHPWFLKENLVSHREWRWWEIIHPLDQQILMIHLLQLQTWVVYVQQRADEEEIGLQDACLFLGEKKKKWTNKKNEQNTKKYTEMNVCFFSGNGRTGWERGYSLSGEEGRFHLYLNSKKNIATLKSERKAFQEEKNLYAKDSWDGRFSFKNPMCGRERVKDIGLSLINHRKEAFIWF